MRPISARRWYCAVPFAVPLALCSSLALAANCKNVDFVIKNHVAPAQDITIMEVQYLPAGANHWSEENLTDHKLSPGESRTWNNQDLQNLNSGQSASWQVIFKTGGNAGGFFNAFNQQFSKSFSSRVCHDNDKYTFDLTGAP